MVESNDNPQIGDDDLVALLGESIGQAVASVADSGELESEFLELAKVDGKITIPSDPAGKEEWFTDLIVKAAGAGYTKQATIGNLSRMKFKGADGKGHYIGAKAAGTFFTNAKRAVRNEMILARYPHNGLNEKDQNRVCDAFWSMNKPMVKTEIGEIPIQAALNVDGTTRAVFLDLVKIQKHMSKVVRFSDVERKLLKDKIQTLKNAATGLAQSRDEILQELKKFFNTDTTRGRGSNAYALIGSELDFDSNEE